MKEFWKHSDMLCHILGVNESMAVTYWQTPDENMTSEAVATREYIKEQFISDNVTYIVFFTGWTDYR